MLTSLTPRILLDGNNLVKGELPSDIRAISTHLVLIISVRSYLSGLLVAKLISTPFEVSEIATQIRDRLSGKSVGALLLSYIFNSKRRKLMWSGLGTDLITVLPSIIIENIVFDALGHHHEVSSTKRRMIATLGKLVATVFTYRVNVTSIAYHNIYPLEVLRTRIIEKKLVNKLVPDVKLQIPPASLESCLRDVFVNPWILIFGSGFQPSLMKVILYIGLKDMIYNQLKSFAMRQTSRQEYKWQPEDDNNDEYLTASVQGYS